MDSPENVNEDYISDVYGSTRYSYVGHSRFPWEVPEVSEDALQTYIHQLETVRIPFYFVMNNLWFKSREGNDIGRENITREVRKLIDFGIKGVILANPLLIKFMHEQFSNLTITASINLELTSVSMITEYLKLGADRIVLGRDVTRDFALLRTILPKYGEKIVLLANTSCILFCPLQYYHSLVTGYETLKSIGDDDPKGVDEGNDNPDFCFKYCRGRLLDHPAEILKMPWIRPEDIKHYSAIGLKYLKIQGRTKNVPDQGAILKAYIARKPPQDDFFFLWPNIHKQLNEFLEKNKAPGRKPFNYTIKNSDLDDLMFFKYFLDKTHDCRSGCHDCLHCEKTFNAITSKYKDKVKRND
jgi:collagenase-like PrtC family protease